MLGLSLLILGAIMFIVTTLMNTSETQIGINSVCRAVQGIKEASDFVYVSGYPSRIKKMIYVPDNIENITLRGRLIKMRVPVEDAYTDIYAITKGNRTKSASLNNTLISNPSKGSYVLVFKSLPIESGFDVNVTIVQ